jgi:putative membrane protein
MMGWYGTDGWWGAGMMMFMGVFWFALIAVAVWAIVKLTRQTGAPGTGTPGTGTVEPTRHVLDRRLAAGEIDAEHYAEMRRVLEGRSADRATH